MITTKVSVSLNIEKEYFDLNAFADDLKEFISNMYCMKEDDVLVNPIAVSDEPDAIDKTEKLPKYDSDAVNCPKHYQLFPEYGLEVIDALEARATPEEWRGYLKLTAD